jgi:hypothetical protein
LSILNGTGDTTLGWTEDQDATVAEWVRAYMEAGYTFFFVNPSGQEIRLKSFDEAKAAGRKIVLGSKDSDEILWNTGIGLVDFPEGNPADQGEIETTGRAKTPEEVASAPATVAVPPARGG